MTEGNSVDLANAVLSAMLQGVPFVLDEAWLQVHVGPPGADGTDNPADEDRRFDLSAMFGADPADGEITNDAASAVMDSVAATEDWSHWSLWDDEFGGRFWQSGALTGGSVTIGQDVQILASQMTVDMPTAS